MSVQLFRHAWGAVGPGFTWKNLPDFTRDAALEGYAGVEFPLFYFDMQEESTEKTESDFREVLAETGLDFIPLIATLPKDWGDYAGHIGLFKEQIQRAKDWGVRKASVHAGADSFDSATDIKFYRETTVIARDAGIEPYYETHRARPMYNPWRTIRILDTLSDIWITADFAHWMPVLDRIPRDLDDLFSYCCERTGHLHARVGSEKSPQVPDPRDPAWKEHLAIHEHWWDQCIAAAEKRGETMVITPEFGPWPYLARHPFSDETIADVTSVVAWMKERLRARYM